MYIMTTITQFLHYDSIFANYITDINNTAGATSSAYKCIFPMTSSFRNVKRCYLKTLELPVGFSNIRKGSTDTFKFILNGTTYTVTLADKNYTTIASLLVDLNTTIVTTLSGSGTGATMVISVLSTNKLNIAFNSNVFTFSILDTNLSKYMLGFRTTDSFTANTFTAMSQNYNLNADNYILMYVPTLNGMNASMGGTISTFKIPFNAVQGQVYYYQSNSAYEQFVDVTNKSMCINNMEVHFIDRYGKNINPSGFDYSFTMAIEYVL